MLPYPAILLKQIRIMDLTFENFVEYLSTLWAGLAPLIMLIFGLAVAFYLAQRIVRIIKQNTTR